MHGNYKDIYEATTKNPMWFDQNGTPRFGKFTPEDCPNIYSNTVVLLEIECQSCGREFDVEMHSTLFDDKESPPKNWHYGDPPAHGCVGDSMNCIDNEVKQVWHRNPMREWRRKKKLEGKIE